MVYKYIVEIGIETGYSLATIRAFSNAKDAAAYIRETTAELGPRWFDIKAGRARHVIAWRNYDGGPVCFSNIAHVPKAIKALI